MVYQVFFIKKYSGRGQGRPFRPAAPIPWVVHYMFRVFPYKNVAYPH